MSKVTRWAITAGALVALVVPLGAAADGGGSQRKKERRILFRDRHGGNLLRFDSRSPRHVRSKQITGLPMGVTLGGIDFRPATGDLYALGSDKVVYRVNVATAIAVAEGPAFETAPAALNSGNIGFDFNPTVDKIRVTSEVGDNIRLNPDEGNLLSKDTSLTPAGVQVVGSAYTNSSFTAFATRPTVTELYALDVAPSKDRLWIQRPADNGTLIMPTTCRFSRRASTTSSGSLAPATRSGVRTLLRRDVPSGRAGSLARRADRGRRSGALPGAERHRRAGGRQSTTHRARGAPLRDRLSRLRLGLRLHLVVAREDLDDEVRDARGEADRPHDPERHAEESEDCVHDDRRIASCRAPA